MGKPWGNIHFFVIIMLVCVVGCYTFDKKKTIIRTDQTRVECNGPGMEDGVTYRLEKCEYKIDDGKRLSVGLFPGMDDYCSGKHTPADHIYWSFWCNLIWGVPTLASLFYDPFFPNESGVAEMGLVGAYRWHIKAREERDKVLETETVIISGSNSTSGRHKPQVERARDGTPLFLIYPGIERVRDALKSSDYVDVLHFSGDNIRRFERSSLNECALKFEDRSAENESCSVERKKFLLECVNLKSSIAKLRKEFGSGKYDDALWSLESAIDTEKQSVGWDWNWVQEMKDAIVHEVNVHEKDRIARIARDERLRAMKIERLSKPGMLEICGIRFGDKVSNDKKSLSCKYGPFSNVLIKTDDDAKIKELIFWDWTSFPITVDLAIDPGEANTPGPIRKFQSLRTVHTNIPISGGRFPDENSAHAHLDKKMREFIKTIESEYEIKLGYRTGGFLNTRLGYCSNPRHGRYSFSIEYSSHPPGENAISWTYKSFKNALTSPLKSTKEGLGSGVKVYYWLSIRDMGKVEMAEEDSVLIE